MTWAVARSTWAIGVLRCGRRLLRRLIKKNNTRTYTMDGFQLGNKDNILQVLTVEWRRRFLDHRQRPPRMSKTAASRVFGGLWKSADEMGLLRRSLSKDRQHRAVAAFDAGAAASPSSNL